MQSHEFSGFGIGLRPAHYQTIVDTRPAVDWFEIISEDFMVDGGSPLFFLDSIRQDYPVAMHGVSLSIGSCDPLDMDYLQRLKQLMTRVDPLCVSDHICWTGVNGVNLHDLMPLPQTQETVEHVVQRVKEVQDYLGRQLLLENVSSYVTFRESEMTEWEFIAEIAERADCFILLDINNIFVNAFNHGFSGQTYLEGIPKHRVRQFHIAGHDHCKTHIIDTHDSPVVEDVWDLYERALKHFGSVPTLIERDANIPDVPVLLEEMEQAKQRYQVILCEEVL